MTKKPAPDLQNVDWQPDRNAALERLNLFQPHMGSDYARQRNFDYGPDDRSNISALSPWISHRQLAEWEVLETCLERFSYSSAEKFIQEVLWRGYFKGWLEHRPGVWHNFRDSRQAWLNRLENDSDLQSRCDAATHGNTGIKCYDTWTHELKETGYLHNHARMWFASIWIFTLELPWELGADFFLRQLLDGDPASNTLSWRWVGGLHTRGKTYLARPDNIKMYTDGRFSPSSDQLSSSAPPVDGPDNPDRGTLPLTGECPDHDYALLIPDCDLHVQSLDLPRPPKCLMGFNTSGDRCPEGLSDKVASFSRSALDEAVSEAAARWGCPVIEDDGDMVLSLKNQGINTLVTPYIPTGWSRDKLIKIKAKFEEQDIEIIEIIRPYDQAVWPHATAGFFKLRKQIPDILRTLGLAS